MSDRIKDKYIHDMNSALSSIAQALDIVKDSWKSDEEIVEQLMPLISEKMDKTLDSWSDIKDNLL